MTKVFLSYASADRSFADSLAVAMEAAGLEVLRPEEDIAGGDPIVGVITRAIESADVAVVLASANSALSPWVETESALLAGKALAGRGSGVLPVLIGPEAELPYPLQMFQGLRLRDASSSAFDDVVHSVELMVAREANHDAPRLERDAVTFQRLALEDDRRRYLEVYLRRVRLLERIFGASMAVIGVVALVAAVAFASSEVSAALSASVAAFTTGVSAALAWRLARSRDDIQRLRARSHDLERQLDALEEGNDKHSSR